MDFNSKQKTIKINNYGDITGEFIEEKTPETVNQIANSLATFFKVLKAQDSYNKVLRKFKRSRSKAESALSANQKTYQQAKIEGNKRAENMCLNIIEKNNEKIKKIDLNSQQAEIRYLNFIKKLTANDTNAQLYVQNIINI